MFVVIPAPHCYIPFSRFFISPNLRDGRLNHCCFHGQPATVRAEMHPCFACLVIVRGYCHELSSNMSCCSNPIDFAPSYLRARGILFFLAAVSSAQVTVNCIVSRMVHRSGGGHATRGWWGSVPYLPCGLTCSTTAAPQFSSQCPDSRAVTTPLCNESLLSSSSDLSVDLRLA